MSRPIGLMVLAMGAAAAPSVAQAPAPVSPIVELVMMELRALEQDVGVALARLEAARRVEPAATPALPQERLVMAVPFRTGDVTVSAEERARLLGAAAAIQQLGTSSLRVVGFTDRTGTRSANERIAELRANVVADLLIEGGFPASRIQVVSGVAEDWPLPVPTAEGVNEPGNRVAHLFALD